MDWWCPGMFWAKGWTHSAVKYAVLCKDTTQHEPFIWVCFEGIPQNGDFNGKHDHNWSECRKTSGFGSNFWTASGWNSDPLGRRIAVWLGWSTLMNFFGQGRRCGDAPKLRCTRKWLCFKIVVLCVQGCEKKVPMSMAIAIRYTPFWRNWHGFVEPSISGCPGKMRGFHSRIAMVVSTCATECCARAVANSACGMTDLIWKLSRSQSSAQVSVWQPSGVSGNAGAAAELVVDSHPQKVWTVWHFWCYQQTQIWLT